MCNESITNTVNTLNNDISSIGSSISALSGDISSLVTAMTDSCGGDIDVRQTVFDGRRNSGGYADFIEASGDSNIVSLLHFNSDVVDQTGLTWTPYGSPTYTTGVFGQAINFNGSTQYLETPASSFSSTISGLQDWTIRFKIKFNALGYNYYIFGQCNNNASKSMLIELTTANKILIAASGGFILTSAQGITDANFHEITIERYNGVMSIYIDGVKDTNTYSGGLSLTNTSDPYQIAGDYGNSQYRLNGIMDEFVVYNTAIYKGQGYTPATSETPYIAPSLTAVIKASESEPLIITAADGYSTKGAVDYTTAITTDSTVTLVPNATNYIYVDYDKTNCTWSFGATTLAPIYSNKIPTATNGQNTFNIPKMKMFGTTNQISTVETVDVFGDGSCKALYRFEDNTNDDSGVYNATASNITYGTGRFGRAAFFNSVSGKITTTLINPINNFSVSTWVNLNSFNARAPIWTFVNGSADSKPFLYANGDGILNFGINAQAKNFLSASSIPLNTFVHLVLTCSTSGVYTLYINSVKDTQTSAVGNCAQGPFILGYESNMMSWLSGYQDQTRYFDKALTPEEVAILYTEQKGAVIDAPRVFLGEVVTDSSKATNVISYAMKGKYIGSEFTPSASSIKVENHNIGTNHNLINAKCALRYNATDNGELIHGAVYDITGALQGSLGNPARGAAISVRDNKKLALATGTYLDGAINTGYLFSSMIATISADRGW